MGACFQDCHKSIVLYLPSRYYYSSSYSSSPWQQSTLVDPATSTAHCRPPSFLSSQSYPNPSLPRRSPADSSSPRRQSTRPKPSKTATTTTLARDGTRMSFSSTRKTDTSSRASVVRICSRNHLTRAPRLAPSRQRNRV